MGEVQLRFIDVQLRFAGDFARSVDFSSTAAINYRIHWRQSVRCLRHRDFQPFGDSGLGRRDFCDLHRNHRIHGRKFRNCLGTNRLPVVS